MKHDALIAPDESQFAFTPKIAGFAANDGSTDSITVPDAHLLFSGDFKRSGDDLKIAGDDGSAFVITDYFKTDKRPTLLSPEGAAILGEVVDMLAGSLAPGQYAQATPQPGTAEAIGRVAVVSGNVTIIRNGVAINVNAGDAILKNDVIQTGAGASCGIAFNDGSTFNIAASARLAINEFVYNPNGSGNASLVTLLQGAATFVAGQVAKTGDMKVATPVATMGIRGTAVILDINAADGRVSISVIDQRDNQTHNVEVFDRAGNLIATATSVGGKLFLTPTTTLDVIASFTNKTPDQVAQEFAAFQSVLSSYDAAKQFFPNLPDHTDVTPRSTQHAQGSGGVPTTDAGTGTTTPDSVQQASNLPDVVFTRPADSPTGSGTSDPDNPAPVATTEIFTPPSLNFIVGSGEINGTAGADQITGSAGTDIIDAMAGNDFVFALGGSDTIIGGHGEGDDYYDGGSGFDTVKFQSAHGVTFNLNFNTVAGVKVSAADSAETGHDLFVNIEEIVASPGDDVFILHDAFNWHIDAGGGFDIIKLIAGLDIFGDGPEVSNFEMVDLTNGGSNVVEFEGGGIDENNPDGALRILGDSQDVVKLTPGGTNGHWEIVSEGGGPDDELFGEDDHHSDGVVFDTYIFVDDYGATLATIYIDTDVTVDIANSEPPTIDVIGPEEILIEDEGGSAHAQVAVTDPDSDVRYVLNDTWSPVLPELNFVVQEFNGHYYAFVPLDYNETWTQAQNMAEEMGGYLATITSAEENEFVAALLDGHVANGATAAFIGGSDAGSEGLWYWNSGLEGIPYFWNEQTFSGSYDQYHNWRQDPFEPNGGSNENYLVMEGNGTWNDVANDHAYAVGYVIEFSTYRAYGKYGYAEINTATGAVTYYLDNNDPDTQALGQNEQVFDSFMISVNDGNSTVTEPVNFAVEGANDAPVVDSHDAAVDYDLGDPGVSVNSDITLADIDSDTLAGAKIAISNFVQGDTLIFANAGNITGNFDPQTGVLTLMGEDSLGNYQLALRSISYQNVYPEALTGDRTITFEVDDGAEHDHASNVATSTVHVDDGHGEEIPNQAPVINIDELATTDDPDSTTVLGLSVSDDDRLFGDQYTVTASALRGTLSESEGNPASEIEFHASFEGLNNKLAGGITYVDPETEPGATVNDRITLTVTDANGGSDTITFVFNVSVEGDEGVTLAGTDQRDIIFSTGNDDTLSGGAKSDAFVFSFDENQIGDDTITDFDVSEDRVVFDGGEFGSFEQLLPHITYDAESNTATIDLGEDGAIVLNTVPENSLTANNFVFHPWGA